MTRDDLGASLLGFVLGILFVWSLVVGWWH